MKRPDLASLLVQSALSHWREKVLLLPEREGGREGREEEEEEEGGGEGGEGESSDFSREVLKSSKISSDFSREMLKCMKISNQKARVFDTCSAGGLYFARVIF